MWGLILLACLEKWRIHDCEGPELVESYGLPPPPLAWCCVFCVCFVWCVWLHLRFWWGVGRGTVGSCCRYCRCRMVVCGMWVFGGLVVVSVRHAARDDGLHIVLKKKTKKKRKKKRDYE